MEFKGTKGEWHACCTDKGLKSHFVFDDGEGTICAMRSNDPNDKQSDFESMEGIITIEQRQANACLIAAAPELLEALQTCLRRIKNESHEPFAIPEAVKAINKALNK